MSKNRPIIVVDNPPSYFPDRFKRDDRVLLDPGEFRLTLSKKVGELSDINKISDEAVLGGSLPKTPVNDLILEKFIDPNIGANALEPIPVSVFTGANRIRPDRLQVINASDNSGTYDIEVKRSADHWLTKAAVTTLNEIDLGSFEFNQTNVENNWANGALYLDGNVGIYLPLVHYGAWTRDSEIITEDFRPWFHALYVLQQGFCSIGWNFVSPVLESDYGRRLITYILGSSIGNNDALKDSSAFKLKFNIITNRFDIVVFDNGNNIAADNSFITPGYYDFYLELKGDFVNHDASGNSRVATSIYVSGDDGAQENDLYLPPGPFNIQMVLRDAFVAPGENAKPIVTITGLEGIDFEDGYFYNVPKRRIFQEGDTLILNEWVSSEHTLLDFFKGIVHLFRGKIVTDWKNKTVTLLPPFDVDVYGDLVDGFYDADIEVFSSDTILGRSKEVSLRPAEKVRNIEITFKNSNDAYIRAQDFEKEPFSKEVDFGEQFEGEKKYENPFFEPTLNVLTEDIPRPLVITNPLPVDLPHLWDNEEGKLSFDIAPRILYVAGLITQGGEAETGVEARLWSYKKSLKTQIPFAFQVPVTQERIGSFPAYSLQDIEENLVYGELPNDFYTLFWERSLYDETVSIRISFRQFYLMDQYENEDFRGIKQIEYDGNTFLCRAEEIVDFDPDLEQATIIYRPYKPIGDHCLLPPEVAPTCDNNPLIVVTGDLDTLTVSAVANDALVNSAIDTDTWEVSTDNGDSYSPYIPGNVVNTDNAIFRRTVTYSDECPDNIVTATWKAAIQCLNFPEIIISHNNPANTVTATAGGSTSSPINTDTWTVDIDNGGENPYTPGTEVTGFNSVRFKRVVTFSNLCDDVTVESVVIADPNSPNCQNLPELQFDLVAGTDCFYTISLKGSTSSTVFRTDIQISPDNGSNWASYTGAPFLSSPDTLIRALVYYCDACPPTCIEELCPQ